MVCKRCLLLTKFRNTMRFNRYLVRKGHVSYEPSYLTAMEPTITFLKFEHFATFTLTKVDRSTDSCKVPISKTIISQQEGFVH